MFTVNEIKLLIQRLVHVSLGLLLGMQNCENNLLTVWGRLLDLACLDNKLANDFDILYLIYFLLSIVICYV